MEASSKRALRKQRRKTFWEDAKNLPNLLTVLRVVAIPVVLWLLERGTPRDCYWAAFLYTLASVTDLVDGWLARRMGVVSVLGKFLDPLADKLFVIAVAIWLIPMGRISEWVVALLIAREVTITALRSIAISEGVVIAAGDDGKAKTAFQMIGIICLVLGFPYELNLGVVSFGVVDMIRVGNAFVYLSIIYSLMSAASYFGLFVDAIEANRKRDSEGDG